MMKRVFAVTARDFRSSLRDFLTAWVFVFPPILALVARLFIPAVVGATVRLVTTPEVGDELIGRLKNYAVVEVVRDREALESRVLALDSSIGILGEGAGYRIILEGNESEQMAAMATVVLADALGGTAVPVRSSDLGRTSSPIHGFLAVMYALLSLMMAGSLIALSIVEDKETGCLNALTVSPLSRVEYLAGKGLLGFAMSLLIVFSMLYLMGAAPFDPVKVLVVTVTGFAAALLAGYYVGAVSDTQIAGIAGLKTTNLAFVIVPLVSLVLPEGLEFALWPFPTYWTYLAYRAVLIDGSPWPQVLWPAGIGLGLGLLLVAASLRFLHCRLLFRG